MEKTEEERNLYDSAGILSRIFFWWLNPLLKLGLQKELEEKDLYQHPKTDDSERLGNLLQKEWSNELKKKNPSLLKSLLRVFGYRCLLFVPLILFQECIILIIQAYLIGVVIEYFEYKLEEDQLMTYISASGVCVSALIYLITFHTIIFGLYRLDIKISIACSSIIYRKALKLSHASLRMSNIGQMVNLLSNDVNKFQTCIYKVFYLISGPLQIILTTIMLWHYVGPAVLAGISMILLYVMLQVRLGKIAAEFRLKSAKITDKRLNFLNEMLAGMRVIKMHTWESLFLNSIEGERRKEIQTIKKSLFAYGIPYAMGLIFSKLMLFLSFFTFFLTGGELTAAIVFITTSLSLNLYRSMFYLFPRAIFQTSEAFITVKRIQKFLLLEEKEDVFAIEDYRPCLNDCGIWMERIFSSWNKDTKSVLQNITLNAYPGDLLTIVGPVGSGKTSLLMTMLGEIPISSGEIQIKGKVAYASQEAWLFNGTVRENILFDNVYHKKKFKEVLYISALEKDISILPDGDLTLVGERGTIMSGGQKARINLARALYLDADIFILDDPLSAVDPPVAKHIFENCIKGYLKEKITVLVTHQVQFLKAATKIIVLNDGRIEAIGNYDEMKHFGINLDTFSEESKENKEYILDSAVLSFPDTNLPKSISLPYNVKNEIQENLINEVKAEENVIIHEVAANKSENVVDEKIGKISGRATAFKNYVNAGIGKFFQFGLLIFFLVNQALINGIDYWLVKWTNKEVNYRAGRNLFENITNKTEDINVAHFTNDSKFFDGNEKLIIWVYSGLIFGLIISSLITTILYLMMCTRSSINLHRNMLNCITGAPIAFLDTNPAGKVLNRFSRDMGIIDQQLPTTSLTILNIFTNSIGMIVMQGIIYPYLIIPSFILLTSAFFIWYFFIKIASDLKRLEGITSSPVYSHLSTSLYGITTIRAFKAEKNFELTFDKYLNKNTSCKFLLLCTNHWCATKVHASCSVNIIITMFTLLFVSSSITGGEIGLAVTYSLTIFMTLALILFQLIDAETQLTSVERVVEYTKIASEILQTPSEKRPPDNWPQKGIITFQDVSLKYEEDKPLVLEKLNFSIESGERVGIVGRTGAGKSSIIAAMFRMTEPIGTISIDGVVTKDICLRELRRKISIIPQNPLLFSGSIRKNIDPFDKHTDETLWKVLADVNLKNAVKNLKGGLDAELSEGGNNFSVGQRQLICVARAILHQNKILILDEATANIDKETDSVIQKIIREKFSSSTILTIAHRLQTIMDSDRVMVLHCGKIEEFDEPYALLKNTQSIFYNMVMIAGIQIAKYLCLNNKTYLKMNNIKKKNKKPNEKCNVINSTNENDVTNEEVSAEMQKFQKIV